MSGDGMSEIVPIVVSKLGRGHYTTIAEALQAAPLGVLIQVEAGVYREGVVLDKPVEIAGMGRAEDTVIESTDAPCLTMKTDQAVVRNLSLRLQPQPDTAISTEQGHYGVDIPMGQLTFLDCWVTSRSWSCVGIHGEAADPIIRRCTLHHSSQAGLLVKEGGRGHIEDCTIIGNQVAVEVRQGSRPSLRGCIMREHPQHGVYIHTDAEATLESCEISECENGVFVSEKGSVLLHHCRIHDARGRGVWISEATAT